MDIGLILSIAAGVVIGGLVLIYRGKIVVKGQEAVEITAEGAKAAGRGIYAIRGWLISISFFALAAAIFVFSRVEKNYDHWLVNKEVGNQMQAACRAEKGSFYSERKFMYCIIDGQNGETSDTWQYDRAGCQMIYYSNGERISAEYVDRCAEVSFNPYAWWRILEERKKNQEN